jgi:beta-mannosidase
LTALTKQDYQGWINKAVVGNQVMLRVWGGGIYEPDIFYEECDRVGILVWQDFMFACGAYPYFAEFAKSVRKEAEDQVKRLRNFCSVAIFAGNNEDYMVAEAKNLEYDRNDLSGDYTKTAFPARTAYETDFPRIVSKYSDVPYHPGSPWGGVNIGDPTIGDIHQWNVWHGQQEKYQNWRKLGGRFVSEFGMLAFPPLKTIKKVITDPQQRYPQSITMDSHNKATGFERRLALYVMENIRVRGMDLESWIYATQLMQSECLAYAYRCWRREWKGPGREYIAGALVWQINDCWPVTSWAICDFYGNNKLAYYAIKRESAQFGVGIYRWTVDEKNGHDEWDLEGPHDLKDKNYIFDVWGVNMTLEPVKVTVQIRYFNVKSGKAGQSFETKEIELLPNRSTEILQDLSVDQETAVQARLLDANGQVIARQGDWPQPLKYLSFPDRKVSVQVSDGKVVISTNAPVKGVEVYLEDEEREVDWQDNGVDVFPGDDFVIEAPGIKADDEVLFRYYEQE